MKTQTPIESRLAFFIAGHILFCGRDNFQWFFFDTEHIMRMSYREKLAASFDLVFLLYKHRKLTDAVIVQALVARCICEHDIARLVRWLQGNGTTNGRGQKQRRGELALALLEGLLTSADKNVTSPIAIALLMHNDLLYHALVHSLLHPRHARNTFLEL